MRVLYDSAAVGIPAVFPAGRRGWIRTALLPSSSPWAPPLLASACSSSAQRRLVPLTWRTFSGQYGRAVVVSSSILGSPPPLLVLPLRLPAWPALLAAAVRARSWALVAVSTAGDTVVAACSAVSPPPLVWWADSGRLVIASVPADVAGIVPGLRLRSGVCSSLVHQCGFYGVHAPFVGVRTVEPGQALFWRGVSARVSEPDRANLPGPHSVSYERASFDDVVATVRRAVDASVGGVLANGGPWGVTLSSGLDSTLVAVRAAALRPHSPLFLYTHLPVRPWPADRDPDGPYGEKDVATATAARFSNAVHRIAPTPVTRRLTALADAFCAQTGFPILHLGGVDMLIHAARLARRDGCRGLLLGAAGNLTVSRRAALSSSVFRHRLFCFARLLNRLVHGRRLSDLRAVARAVCTGVPQSRVSVAARGVPPVSFSLPRPPRGSGAALYARVLLAWFVEETDVSFADPLDDPLVWAACERLPAWALLHGGCNRSVARALVRSAAPQAADSNQRWGQVDGFARLAAERDLLAARWRRRLDSPAVTDWMDPCLVLRALRTLPAVPPVRTREHPDNLLYDFGIFWNEGVAAWLEWLDGMVS